MRTHVYIHRVIVGDCSNNEHTRFEQLDGVCIMLRSCPASLATVRPLVQFLSRLGQPMRGQVANEGRLHIGPPCRRLRLSGRPAPEANHILSKCVWVSSVHRISIDDGTRVGARSAKVCHRISIPSESSELDEHRCQRRYFLTPGRYCSLGAELGAIRSGPQLVTYLDPSPTPKIARRSPEGHARSRTLVRQVARPALLLAEVHKAQEDEGRAHLNVALRGPAASWLPLRRTERRRWRTDFHPNLCEGPNHLSFRATLIRPLVRFCWFPPSLRVSAGQL